MLSRKDFLSSLLTWPKVSTSKPEKGELSRDELFRFIMKQGKDPSTMTKEQMLDLFRELSDFPHEVEADKLSGNEPEKTESARKEQEQREMSRDELFTSVMAMGFDPATMTLDQMKELCSK